MKTKPRYFKRSKNSKKEVTVLKKTASRQSAPSHLAKEPAHPEEKRKRPQFPKKSRSIPESTQPERKKRNVSKLPKVTFSTMQLRWTVIGGFIGLGILWNLWVGTLFVSAMGAWTKLLLQRQYAFSQMQLWENIANEYPNYRDAYVEGELYAYQLGDKAKEQYFLGKLQLLDPNFPLTKTFEQLENLQNAEQ